MSSSVGIPSPAHAKDIRFLPEAEGFTPPLSRPAPNNHGHFGSKTASSNSGSPKKGPGSESTSSSGINPNPNPKIPARIDDQSYVKSKPQKKKAENKNYSLIMDELDNQRNKKVVVVEIDGKIYTIKNPYNDGADELQDKLAKKLYDAFRKDNKDVCEIAEKNTRKKENVQKCKDHIFYNEHLLDQYEELGDPAEYRRFDPNLKQALAWQRFKDGIPNVVIVTITAILTDITNRLKPFRSESLDL